MSILGYFCFVWIWVVINVHLHLININHKRIIYINNIKRITSTHPYIAYENLDHSTNLFHEYFRTWFHELSKFSYSLERYSIYVDIFTSPYLCQYFFSISILRHVVNFHVMKTIHIKIVIDSPFCHVYLSVHIYMLNRYAKSLFAPPWESMIFWPPSHANGDCLSSTRGCIWGIFQKLSIKEQWVYSQSSLPNSQKLNAHKIYHMAQVLPPHT